MGRTKIWIPGIFLVVLLAGCGTSNPIVATIDHENITLRDFEDNYAKNNGGWTNADTSSLENRKHFLDLLINFKLKVKEAKERGLLNDTSVTGEFDEYRSTVAQSYVLEKEITAPHVRRMYDHRLQEIYASQIFFRLPQNPTPADTLEAYNSALKVLALLPEVSFDTLARKYSQDSQSAPNGGYIGWVVPGRDPEDVENALYALKEGEYSKAPFRSSLGYHIFKVLRRRPARGAIRISHILKRFSPGLKDTAAVRDTIWQIYGELKHGAVFSELAQKYSDDLSTKGRGGDAGFYERARLRPDIANLLFDFPIDSISAPYHQPYGYHIFQVTGEQPFAPFSQMEKDLRSDYQQRFYQTDYAKYVEGLRQQYGVVVDRDVLATLKESVDTMKTPSSSGWSDTLSADLLARSLFTCGGKPFTVRDFVDAVETGAEYKEMPLRKSNIDVMVDRLVTARVLKEYAVAAIDRYPELKSLMDEYLDGILLYRIEQDEVWNKVVANDSLLRLYYDTTKTNYRWPERVNFAEIFVTSDSLKNVVQEKLSGGADFLPLAEEYTARAGYRDKRGEWGLQPYDLNDLSQKASKLPVDSVSGFFRYQNGWTVIKVLGKDSARVKTFEEAQPELAGSYQEQFSKMREQEWVESLRQKYGVTVNTDLLGQAFKKKHVENN